MISSDLGILVVDDLESGRIAIDNALRQAGYSNIRRVASARDALDQLRAQRADVVLADWVMPEMDGLELTRQIRQQDEELYRYTSIILFTAKEGIDHLVYAFEQGVDDFLNKPVNTRELAARVHAAGRIASLQNTLLETTRNMQMANRKLQEMARTDPLTGLGNRRYMQEHLEAALQECANRGGGICCAMVDIDHFKKVNDEHGHDVGDEVLRSVAERLRRAVRPTDLLARIGGEEFAIVMHYRDMSNFRHSIFARIQSSVSARPISTSVGELAVSVSMGVCCRLPDDPPMDLEMLTKCADLKLYQAKRKGRNQVVY